MNSFAFDYAKMNCIASEFQLDQWEDEYDQSANPG